MWCTCDTERGVECGERIQSQPRADSEKGEFTMKWAGKFVIKVRNKVIHNANPKSVSENTGYGQTRSSNKGRKHENRKLQENNTTTRL